MEAPSSDEWNIVERLLPAGWQDKARELGAFRRVRYTQSPSALLRLILFHAVNDGGLDATVAQARAAGIADISKVALFKRLRTSGPWLRWIASSLCEQFRDGPSPKVASTCRLRAVDSTIITGPASTGADWRLHFALDLGSMSCDWHRLTTGRVAESLALVPTKTADILIADRGFGHSTAIRKVHDAGAHVLLRARWGDPIWAKGAKKSGALSQVGRLRVGEVGEWPVHFGAGDHQTLGRLVAMKLPLPIAREKEKKLKQRASRKQQDIDPRTLKAAHYIMLFTTVATKTLDAKRVMELYRHRWQIEIAFKRLKQLLKLGKLPHKDAAAAESFILAKLVVALLLEKIHRNARCFSPWGFSLETPASAT